MRLMSLLLATSLVACSETEKNPEEEVTVVDADGDGVSEADDCDDSNADINPLAEELCDGIDNNCDDEIDNDASDMVEFYEDADGDGSGDLSVTEMACEAPEGYVDNADDCDDADDSIYLGAEELCDGIDNNCDEQIDEDLALQTYYEDYDEDGFGDSDVTMEDCIAPEGYVDNMMDCDDSNADIASSEDDIDCDGILNTEDDDMDGDGLTTDEECDDSNPDMLLLQDSIESAATDSDGDGAVDSTETTTYDAMGNVDIVTTTTDINDDGDLDTMTQTNSYNADGVLTSVDFAYDYGMDGSIDVTYTSVLTYDGNGNTTSVTAGGSRADGSTFSFSRAYVYNADDNQVSYNFNADWNGDGSDDQSEMHLFTYNGDGNMETQTRDYLNADGAELFDGVVEESYSYTYDGDGNMATMHYDLDNDSDGDIEEVQDRAYTYTSFGEIEEMTIAYDYWSPTGVADNVADVNYTFSYTYNSDELLERQEISIAYVPESLQSYNSTEVTTYTYNGDGNLLTTEIDSENDGNIDTTYTNTYNAEGQLETEETADGTVTYTYMPCM